MDLCGRCFDITPRLALLISPFMTDMTYWIEERDEMTEGRKADEQSHSSILTNLS